MFWDTAAALDDSAGTARDSTLSRPVYAPGAMERMWAEAGLVEIDQRSLMIRMDFTDFADYWAPFASGEGGLGAYVATLDDARRGRLERHLRSAYLTGRPDGERSFVAVALSLSRLGPQDLKPAFVLRVNGNFTRAVEYQTCDFVVAKRCAAYANAGTTRPPSRFSLGGIAGCAEMRQADAP